MTQIDAARLSRALASLSKPKERADSTSDTSEVSAPRPRGQTNKVREPAVLKSRLQGRLRALKQSDADFSEAAPIVTVQEILRWEFGEQVFEHAEFERVASQVAEALLSSEPMRGSIQRLIDEFAN